MIDNPSPKPRQISCAFCDSTDVEFFSLFGQTLLGSQYYCRACRTIFEVIRFDEEPEATEQEPQAQEPTEEK